MATARFELILCSNSTGPFSVVALDGIDDVAKATFADLIDDWLVYELYEGELRPAIDHTLELLHLLNWAQRRIVARIPKDDPHLRDFHLVFDTADKLLQRLKDALVD